MKGSAHTYETYCADEMQTMNLGKRLALHLFPGCVLFLQGDLGAGKTCLTRGLLQGLGYQGKVKSPTYTLMEQYLINNTHINHYDFYRFNTAEELFDLGIEEDLSPPSITIIEWAEKGQPYLPTPDLTCVLRFAEERGRYCQLTSYTAGGLKLLEELVRL